MKKILKLLMGMMLCVASLTACASQDAKTDQAEVTAPATDKSVIEAPQVEEPSVDDVKPSGISSQIQLIYDNRQSWKIDNLGPEPVLYGVTDLDGNGRLELISTLTEGSGMYSTNRYWEVSADYEALESCETNYSETESQVELGFSSVKTLEDGDARYYLFTDTLRDGAAHQYQFIIALSLSDGVIAQTPLATEELCDDGSGVVTTYTDWKNQPISQEEYDDIAKIYFKDAEQQTAQIQWILSDDVTDWESEGLLQQLDESYGGFLVE